MQTSPNEPDRRNSLRSRAVSHLKWSEAQAHALANPSAALRVLHELASSPATAPDALALLHELQVHQVEVDLQAEELRGARPELEASLNRQVQLLESAPVGILTLRGDTVMREVNQMAASMLGVERGILIGRALVEFIAPADAGTLRAMVARASEDASAVAGALNLGRAEGNATCRVHASLGRDPSGEGFIVAMMPWGSAD